MSRSVNRVTLVGNIGADPEIRSTANGGRVANFNLATGRQWTGRDGQKQESTAWHKIVAWDNEKGPKLADVVEKYVRKGDRLYVEGEIEYRSYTDKDGQTKYITEIRAREIVLLGGGIDHRNPSQTGFAGTAAKATSYDDFAPDFPDEGSDLPFS